MLDFINNQTNWYNKKADDLTNVSKQMEKLSRTKYQSTERALRAVMAAIKIIEGAMLLTGGKRSGRNQLMQHYMLAIETKIMLELQLSKLKPPFESGGMSMPSSNGAFTYPKNCHEFLLRQANGF